MSGTDKNESKPEIQHDSDRGRFFVPGEAGESYLAYRESGDGTVDFRSTFVPPARRGEGLAGAIVEAALEWAEGEGYQVIPTCPYVARYIDAHPRFQGLVAED